MRDALLIIFGWLLGMLGGPITTAFRQRHTASVLAEAIVTELREVRSQLVGSAYYIWDWLGTNDRERMKWAASLLEKVPQNPHTSRMAGNIREALKLTTPEIAALMERTKEKGTTVSIRKVELPFLTAHLHELTVFSPASQSALLAVLTQARFFNEQVEAHAAYHLLTFQQGISSENCQAASASATKLEEILADRARDVSDMIDGVEPSWGWWPWRSSRKT